MEHSFILRAKKRAYYAVLANFWQFLVPSCNLGKKNTKVQKFLKIEIKSKKNQKNQKIQKKIQKIWEKNQKSGKSIKDCDVIRVTVLKW